MITEKEAVSLSKFLSLVLRHKPEAIGLELDPNGWAATEMLLDKMAANGKPIEREVLEYIVATNPKKRFAFNEDKTRIRASQGHSVAIDVGYEPQIPPAILYHGTATKNIEAITTSGLLKGKRTHVHLSKDTATAKQVGQRHGKPVIFKVQAGKMHTAGYAFYLSDNGVWLTENIPCQYLKLLQ